MNARDDCPKFEHCSVPLCPWDQDSLEYGLAYPDEPICSLQKANQVDWVRRQRKVARKVKDRERYFTHRMLCRNCRIGVGTKGLDPNRDYDKRAKDEEAWLKEHPEIVVTDELRERGRKAARDHLQKTA
jgi:hypothetical protein